MAGSGAMRAGRLVRGAPVVVFALLTLVYALGLTLTVLARQPLWPDFLVNLILYAFPLVGVLIAVRRPRNRIAWLCLAIGGVWGVEGLILAATAYEAAHPGLLARPDLVLAIGLPLWVPGILLMGTFLPLLFPDGHLRTARARPLVWLSAATTVVVYAAFVVEPADYSDYGFPGLTNPLAVELLHTGGAQAGLAAVLALLPVCIVSSVVVLLRRFRRTTGIERLQLKWLVAAGGLVAPLFLVLILVDIAVELAGAEWTWLGLAGIPVILLFGLIPVAIGVAVLRYRLFEIDRLVSRTVSYALLAGVLAVVYTAGVLLLPLVLPLQGGLAVAASTLVVAALFNPLRKGLQLRVDRRFNRTGYDAEQELARFAGRLRDELDPDTLGSELVEVAVRTMEPATVSVWLRSQR
jgi:hypothetical protein